MAQQTAVEWLAEQVHTDGLYSFKRLFANEIKQAKQMEKEQIIKAWCNGENDSSIDPKLIKDMAEEYYNETYSK